MSSSATASGLQTVLDEADQVAPPEMTIPSHEEIAAQARTSKRLIGTHRQGRCCVEARLVEDGIAYRLMGQPQDAPWEWLRYGDFHQHFQLWSPDNGLLTAVMEQAVDLRNKLDLAIGSMGKASRKRYAKELLRINRSEESTTT